MAISWGDGGDGLWLHCSGIGCPKVVLVGSVHYRSVTVRGGGHPRLVGFAGAYGTGLLPETDNMTATEHVDAACSATIDSFGFVLLGSPDEGLDIENEPEEDAWGSIPVRGVSAAI